MMSSPFDRSTIESRLAARGVKWHRDPEDVIPLWLADPDYPLCPELKEALREAVEEEFTVYSSSVSVLELMAAKISRYNGFEVPAEQVMLTQGIIPGMWLAAEHACRPGDEVIVILCTTPSSRRWSVPEPGRFTGSSSWRRVTCSTSNV